MSIEIPHIQLINNEMDGNDTVTTTGGAETAAGNPHSSELQSNSVFQPLEESLDSILVTLQELGQDEERRSSRILAQLNSMLASSAAMAARLDRVNGTLHDNVAQLLDLDTTLHEGFDNRAELVRSRDA